MPPEAFRRQYGPFVDVWSFGVVLFELYGRTPPWLGYKATEVASRVMRGETLPIPPGTPPLIADLMKDCWAFDPLSRPQAGTLVAVLEREVRDEGRAARRAARRARRGTGRSGGTSDPASTAGSGGAEEEDEAGGGYSAEMVNPYEASSSYYTTTGDVSGGSASDAYMTT
jgi:serine/threonine protein kinase